MHRGWSGGWILKSALGAWHRWPLSAAAWWATHHPSGFASPSVAASERFRWQGFISQAAKNSPGFSSGASLSSSFSASAAWIVRDETSCTGHRCIDKIKFPLQDRPPYWFTFLGRRKKLLPSWIQSFSFLPDHSPPCPSFCLPSCSLTSSSPVHLWSQTGNVSGIPVGPFFLSASHPNHHHVLSVLSPRFILPISPSLPLSHSLILVSQQSADLTEGNKNVLIY